MKFVYHLHGPQSWNISGSSCLVWPCSCLKYACRYSTNLYLLPSQVQLPTIKNISRDGQNVSMKNIILLESTKCWHEKHYRTWKYDLKRQEIMWMWIFLFFISIFLILWFVSSTSYSRQSSTLCKIAYFIIFIPSEQS